MPDAFVRTGLERWLHVGSLRQVVIVGVSTSNSVESTARTAGNLGFGTIVVSDATFTFAKKDYAGVQRSADEVHAMSLANLDGEYATVMSTAQLLGLISHRVRATLHLDYVGWDMSAPRKPSRYGPFGLRSMTYVAGQFRSTVSAPRIADLKWRCPIMQTLTPEVTTEVLQAFADAWNRHDVDALMSFMTEDCVFESSAGADVCGTRYAGREAVRAGFAEVWETFPDAHWGNARHFVHGDRGVSEWTFTGTRADGTRVEAHGCDLFTLRDGKIFLKNSYRKNRPPIPKST